MDELSLISTNKSSNNKSKKIFKNNDYYTFRVEGDKQPEKNINYVKYLLMIFVLIFLKEKILGEQSRNLKY